MEKCVCALAIAAALCAGCGAPEGRSPAPPAATRGQCLPGGEGYLRARLRGALQADLDWADAQMRCEGGLRPDDGGVRVSITGPLPDDAGFGPGRTLRFVFGIDAPRSMEQGHALATNVTALVEGGNAAPGAPALQPALFATRGDERCTTDSYSRASLGPDGGIGAWRVEAHGFCLSPAMPLDGDAGVLVTTFDFAARIPLETP